MTATLAGCASGGYIPDRKHDLVVDAEWSPRHVSPAERLTDPRRPLAVGTRAFEYDELPIIANAADPDDEIRFSVSLPRQGRRMLDVTADVALELESGEHRVFNAPEGAAEGPFWPPNETQIGAQCGGDRQPDPATLRGIIRAAWTADRVDFVVYRGGLDERCRGRAVLAERTTAPALIPSLVYAFRTCVAHCKAPREPGREEELWLIAPTGDWVATTATPDRQTDRRSGAFTLATMRVARGTSGSVLVTARHRNVTYFLGLAGNVPEWAGALAKDPDAEMTFTVDVAWPIAADRPEGLVYASKSR